MGWAGGRPRDRSSERSVDGKIGRSINEEGGPRLSWASAHEQTERLLFSYFSRFVIFFATVNYETVRRMRDRLLKFIVLQGSVESYCWTDCTVEGYRRGSRSVGGLGWLNKVIREEPSVIFLKSDHQYFLGQLVMFPATLFICLCFVSPSCGDAV